MAAIDQLTDNHSRAPVPDGETVGALRIATVLVGVVITLPAFLLGAEILTGLGAVRGMIAILGGGVILIVLAALTMRAGAETRLSTYNLIGRAFGDTGALAVNGLLTDLALFYMSTFIPQLNVFAVSLPVKSGIVAAAMVLYITLIPELIYDRVDTRGLFVSLFGS